MGKFEKKKSIYGNYDPARLRGFYDQRAAVDDLNLSQYGMLAGTVKDPTRHYVFSEKLLKLVLSNINSKARLIDIGCGMGILAESLSGRVNKYIGMDISPRRIAQARSRAAQNNYFFQAADAQYLPFAGASFDTAVAVEVIEHLPDPGLFLQEVNRVLNKRGVFILTTPTGLFSQDKFGRLYQDQHLHEFSIHGVKKLLSSHGFRLKLLTGIGFKSPRLTIPLWLGSAGVKWLYKKIRRVELHSGYAYPVSLQFDIVSNPFLNKLYFLTKRKGLWALLMKLFCGLGKFMPCFSSNLVLVCEKK